MQSGMEKVFLPPRERVNGSAVPAAVTQEARLTPIPGVGIFALGGRGLFAAFGGGRNAAGRQPGKCTLRRAGTRPSRGEGQKGVQDTRTCVPVSYTPFCYSP